MTGRGRGNVCPVGESLVRSEVPGYYYDRFARRYYRKLTSNCPVASRYFHKGSPDDRKLPIQPNDHSLKHLPDFLMKRQLGCKSNAFETKLLKMKTMNLKLTETRDLCATYASNVEEISFLKAGPYSFIVEYRVNTGPVRLIYESVVSEIPHRFTPDRIKDDQFRKYTVSEQSAVNDICTGFTNDECIMYVGNSLKKKMGITQIMFRPSASDGVERVVRHFTCICPVWCCSSNNFTEQFALGLEDAFSINSAYGNLYSRNVKGNVRGVTFNEKGNLVYCALHNGKMVVIDLRTLDTVKSKRIDKIGLDEVVLTADENYLICGGFDGLLCKLDLRSYHKVLEYIGHVHTPWKTPFSISEPHDILCATGSDNVTRLWSLADGGDPLNYILPPVEGSFCRSCLMTDGSRVSVCMTQKRNAMIYDIYT